MRLFIGLPLPESLRKRIVDAVGALSGARVVPVENLHLTMRFIGDVSENQAEDVKLGLAEVSVPRFSLALGGAGTFPPRGLPRVLWFGAERAGELLTLKTQIDDALAAAIDLEPERRSFSPHVTVARLKKPKKDEIERAKQALAEIEAAPLAVEAFVLFESNLTPKGAVYREIRRYELS